MGRWVLVLAMICSVIDVIVCPPVSDKAPSSTPPPEGDDEVNFGLEYERYLKEIVSALETDESFRKKLEDSNISDIKSGEIAKHLDFVGHGIRTQLDEIKRKEVDRLRQIVRLQNKIRRGMNDDGGVDSQGSHNVNMNMASIDKERLLAHLDETNPNTFEVEDLSRLIKRATKDLEDIDDKRRKEFKNYELEKEHLRRKEMDHMDEAKRAEAEKKYDEMKKKHADHPKLHHPGAEEQLKEVWEESDGLNKKDFDPRTFFYLHDANGDNQLDESELEALFQKELDKAYDPNQTEDDMVERYEEMNRMREHVMKEVDSNQDRLISLEEFLDSTQQSDFKKDQGWDTLDHEKQYTDEELDAFEKQYEELRRQQEEGVPVADLQVPVGADAPAGVNVMHQEGRARPMGGVAAADDRSRDELERDRDAGRH